MLSLEVEKEIHRGLLKGTPVREIGQKLLQKKKFLKDTEAFLHICRFLFHGGLNRLLVQTALLRLEKEEVAPYAFLVEIFHLHKISLPSKTLKLFLKGLTLQNQVLSMTGSRSWDHHLPRLKELKARHLGEFYKKQDKEFYQGLEDLKFVRSQGLSGKEKEILKQLKKKEPLNPLIHQEWLQFEEKEYREVVSRQGPVRFKVPSRGPGTEDPELKKQIHSLLQEVQKKLKNKPENSYYDMALLFSFMGQSGEALKVLENRLSGPSSLWLYVELLMQSRLYLRCLEVLDQVELKWKGEPDTLFAITYARARACHGLGQKKRAVQLLSDLVSVKPGYRLARFLLQQWERE